MASYKKVIRGHENTSNETASHNRIQVETGSGFKILAIFFCILITAAILFVAKLNLQLVETLVTITFIAVFVVGWVLLVAFTRRSWSSTITDGELDKAIQARAKLERKVMYATETYIVYEDQDGKIQFQGTVTVNENRTFPAQIAAPPDMTEMILADYDLGMSGRAIEKHLKEHDVKYPRIQKVLNLYRPEWNKKTVESSDTDV